MKHTHSIYWNRNRNLALALKFELIEVMTLLDYTSWEYPCLDRGATRLGLLLKARKGTIMRQDAKSHLPLPPFSTIPSLPPPSLSPGSVATSNHCTKVGIGTVLTTTVQSQSYQHVAKSWKNMSRSIFSAI